MSEPRMFFRISDDENQDDIKINNSFFQFVLDNGFKSNRFTKKTVKIDEVFGTFNIDGAHWEKLNDTSKNGILTYINELFKYGNYRDRWKKIQGKETLKELQEVFENANEPIELIQIGGKYYIYGGGHHRIFALLTIYFKDIEGKSEEEIREISEKYKFNAHVKETYFEHTCVAYLFKNLRINWQIVQRENEKFYLEKDDNKIDVTDLEKLRVEVRKILIEKLKQNFNLIEKLKYIIVENDDLKSFIESILPEINNLIKIYDILHDPVRDLDNIIDNVNTRKESRINNIQKKFNKNGRKISFDRWEDISIDSLLKTIINVVFTSPDKVDILIEKLREFVKQINDKDNESQENRDNPQLYEKRFIYDILQKGKEVLKKLIEKDREKSDIENGRGNITAAQKILYLLWKIIPGTEEIDQYIKKLLDQYINIKADSQLKPINLDELEGIIEIIESGKDTHLSDECLRLLDMIKRYKLEDCVGDYGLDEYDNLRSIVDGFTAQVQELINDSNRSDLETYQGQP